MRLQLHPNKGIFDNEQDCKSKRTRALSRSRFWLCNHRTVDEAKATADKAAADAAAAVSAAEAARAAADRAAQAAAGAQSTADQALSAATEAQACCEANRESMERMFQKSMSK